MEFPRSTRSLPRLLGLGLTRGIVQDHLLTSFTAFAASFAPFRGLLPICQPHDLSTLTTLGVTAAVKGTRTKIKLLWMAYAKAN